jgi:diguanylate cyclase (GGDEF)-like protein
MLRWNNRLRPWSILAAMAFCVLVQCALPAMAQPPDFAALLEHAQSVRTRNHPQFLLLLKQLDQQASGMSASERWQLRYLDAWQTVFQGDYPHANVMLEDIIKHSGDAALVAEASALLMDNMGVTKHYVEAFELANQLVADLPKTQDKEARYLVLFYVSQLLSSAGQYDLAIQHIREVMQTLPPQESACHPMTLLMVALYGNHQLTSSSAELQQGINACDDAGEPVYGDNIRLVKAGLYVDEGQPQKAIDLLDKMASSVNASHYYSHMLAAEAQLAQAYWKLGDDSNAFKAALAALAISHPDDMNGSLRDDYQVLYSIERKRGNAVAALKYYEQYVVQNTGYLNDLSARALAFDVARQHVLAQKLETEKLSKQNSILRLQEALATKAAETGRLYIALLLVVLVSIVFWLFRLKRSQLRFKHLARLDGLTGIFNHQHFIGEADEALRLLEKKSTTACLAFIDLDHFKLVNDTYGHAVGDEVLKRVVAICQQHLRETDLFGRLGGEEFGILLLDCSRDRGVAVADRIRLAIEATSIDGDGYAISFSASVGLVCTETYGYDLQRLCREADAALYRAKRTGRNRVIVDTGHESPAEA